LKTDAQISLRCFISSLLQLIVVVASLLLAQYVMETAASQKLEIAARPAKQQSAGRSGSPSLGPGPDHV
jgi:hypothetical protein